MSCFSSLGDSMDAKKDRSYSIFLSDTFLSFFQSDTAIGSRYDSARGLANLDGYWSPGEIPSSGREASPGCRGP